jgi:hypothetical protein
MARQQHRPFRHHRLAQEIVDRYQLIRALHTCYYTQLGADVQQFSTEFFFLVGDIIEGKTIDESNLHFIDMDRVRQFIQEER